MSPFAHHHNRIETILELHYPDWPTLAKEIRKYAMTIPHPHTDVFESLLYHFLPTPFSPETLVPWLLWEHIGDQSQLSALQDNTGYSLDSMSMEHRSELLNSGIPLLTTARIPLLQGIPPKRHDLLVSHLDTMGLSEPERIEVLPQSHMHPIIVKNLCPMLFPWLADLVDMHHWEAPTVRLLVQNAYEKESPSAMPLPTLES